MNKYKNKKVSVDGKVFDSIKEYQRYCELRLLERAGRIKDLQMQVKFELIPPQKMNGKTVERACSYVADFVYLQDGVKVVEDTKSEATRTKDYIIKRKLMMFIHGISIKEV